MKLMFRVSTGPMRESSGKMCGPSGVYLVVRYWGECRRRLLVTALWTGSAQICGACQSLGDPAALRPYRDETACVFSLKLSRLSEPQSNPDPGQRPPRELKLPRKPSEQGFRLALLVGISILPWADYTYETNVTLP